VIDDHTHQWPLQFAPLEPEGIALDLGLDEAATVRRRSLAPGRLHLHLLVTRLAQLLDVAPGDAVAARDARAAADWHGWVRALFDDAVITGLVLDEPINEPRRTADYAQSAGRPVWSMARIDPLVDDLLAAGASARDIVGAVETAMAEAAAAGCVAFKTALAYRTGLAVDPEADLESAQRSIDDGAHVPVRRRGKALRDLVTRTALGRAADLGKPVQIHTGFGDSDIRLAESDPLLLEEVLRTPEGTAARVVLIHGSFPWHERAAYWASVRPNVWVELSLSNLFAPLGTADRLLEILDLAPRDRIVLGSDGHGTPETHWFGCRTLAGAWRDVAARLAAAGAQRAWIEDTGAALFDGTARALYELSG
jgi:predicted TIM-barrel fold metal-dependent hydrolase